MSRKTLSDNNVTSEKFAWPGTSLFLDQKDAPPLYVRAWMVAPPHSLIWKSGSTTGLFLWGPPPPPPSSEGLDPPLGCFCEDPHPLCQGLDDRRPPPPLPHLKVWIHHWVVFVRTPPLYARAWMIAAPHSLIWRSGSTTGLSPFLVFGSK